MNTINYTSYSQETLVEALKGDYGTVELPNGVTLTKAGRFHAVWGAVSGDVSVLEVPSLPVRYPLLFSGDSATASVVVEPNKGFVDVPQSVRGSRFVVMGFALLK